MKFRYRVDGGPWVEADETLPFTIPNAGLVNSVEAQAIGAMVSAGAQGIAPAVTTAGSLDNSTPAPGEPVTYTAPTFSGVPTPTVTYGWLLGSTDVSGDVGDNGDGTYRYTIPGGTPDGTKLTVVASASGFGSSASTQVSATVVIKTAAVTAFSAFSAAPDPVWPDQVRIDGTVPVLSDPFTDCDWQFSDDPNFATVNASGSVKSLPATVDLSASAGSTVYFRIRGRNASVTGDWPAAPAGPYTLPPVPSQPTFTGDPSISPATGPAGTTFNIALGEAVGVPNLIAYTPRLTLDGADVTGSLNGLEYVSTQAGTLRLVVRASNGIGDNVDSVPAAATVLPAVTAPAQFGNSDWDVFDAGTDGELLVRVNSLPSDGGAPITELRHNIDGAGNHLLTGTPGAGDYTISGLTNDRQVSIRVWAVNSVGAGTPSAAETVTPTKPVTPLSYPDFGIILDHSTTATGTVLAGASGGAPPYTVTFVGDPTPPGTLTASDEAVSGNAGDAQEATVTTTGRTGTVIALGISV